MHARRKTPGKIGHQLLGGRSGVEGIAPRRLVKGDDGRGLALKPSFDIVILCAEFNTCHILEAQNGTVGIGPNHDIAEILHRGEVALANNRVSVFLAIGDGFGADFSDRIDAVLLLDRIDDFLRGDVELGQLIRGEPNAHGVLTGAEDRRVGNSRQAGQLIVQVDKGVIGEEEGVEGLVRRKERKKKQRGGGALLHGRAVFDDRSG